MNKDLTGWIKKLTGGGAIQKQQYYDKLKGKQLQLQDCMDYRKSKRKIFLYVRSALQLTLHRLNCANMWLKY